MFKLSLVLLILANIKHSIEFTPTRNLQLLTELIDESLDEKPQTNTLTHTEILRKGVLKSIVKYFKHKQELEFESDPYRSKHDRHVDPRKIDTHYMNNINELYHDYFGKDYETISKCNLKLDDAIKLITDAVISVDFDPEFKDLPYAHFDADKFIESNQHVNKLMAQVLNEIQLKNYPTARKRIGQVLHTIQDFYAHSNWVEMGYSNRINEKIGSNNNDLGVDLASNHPDLISCLSENCTKQVIQCKYLKSVAALSKVFGIHLPIQCPIVYFKCGDNVIKDKLTSGYYSDQRLEDNSSVDKPMNKSKCSHGGYLDKTSFESSYGGINKDTAYFFLSPHAHLHLEAANLAVEHTEYFFDNLREKIGDSRFDELLQLLHAETSRFDCFFSTLFD